MKLGILADSHDHLDHLRLAVAILRAQQVEVVLHAGDFIAPFTVPILAEVGCPIKAVFGNNDGERVGLTACFQQIGADLGERPRELELGAYRVLLCHEPVAVDRLAGSQAFDLVVYGHTHEVDIRTPPRGALVVNPGEVCGWLSGRATVAVVDLQTRRVQSFDLALQVP